MKDSVNKSSTVDTPKTSPGGDNNAVSPPVKKEVVESSTTVNLGEFGTTSVLFYLKKLGR